MLISDFVSVGRQYSCCAAVLRMVRVAGLSVFVCVLFVGGARVFLLEVLYVLGSVSCVILL